jgi:hypothetical protein
MEKRSSSKQLLVGLDSEYDANGAYSPISTQLSVYHDKKRYFLEHIGRKLSFCELVNFLHEKYQDFESSVVVCHFSKAESLGSSDGLDIVLGGRFLGINMTLTVTTIFRTSDGREIQVVLIDTFLLTSQSLERSRQALMTIWLLPWGLRACVSRQQRLVSGPLLEAHALQER